MISNVTINKNIILEIKNLSKSKNLKNKFIKYFRITKKAKIEQELNSKPEIKKSKDNKRNKTKDNNIDNIKSKSIEEAKSERYIASRKKQKLI